MTEEAEHIDQNNSFFKRLFLIIFGVDYKDLILLILFVIFTSSVMEIFNNRMAMLSITIILGFIFYIKGFFVEKIIIKIFTAIFIIQIISMIRFSAFEFDRYLSIGLLFNRILFPYLILKLVGEDFFIKFEKLSFRMVMIGIPIFILLQNNINISSFFQQFDINTIAEQKSQGGWNIFFYVHNSWASDRFCGYAWEPGMLALMITISWIAFIQNNGTKLSVHILVYIFGIIITYSTTGYMILGLFALFYAFNKSLPYFFSTILIIAIITPVAWSQPFMRDKIIEYYESDQKIQEKGGYEESANYKAGRLGIITVAINEVKSWPIGYGTVKEGRTKNKKGDSLAGANGIASIFIFWGIFGGFFVIYSIYLFVFRRENGNELRGKILLVIAIILVFSSNPTSNNPILITVVLYPFIFKNQLTFNSKNTLSDQNYQTET